MFFIAYAFKGHVHAFAGQVKVVTRPAGQVQYLNIFVPCECTLNVQPRDAQDHQTRLPSCGLVPAR